MNTKPVIAITMGDPAGVGPEIIVQALAEPKLYELCRPLVIGDAAVLEEAARICSVPAVLHIVDEPQNGLYHCGTIDCIHVASAGLENRIYGKIQASCGQAAYACIAKAVELAMAHEVAAVATAPINKEALKAAHIPFIGHTEILAALSHSTAPMTMFEVRGLRAFFLTRHVSLRQACEEITEEGVLSFARQCRQVLQSLGIEEPRLAIAGLNPHAGEHGLFGTEEIDSIIPAVGRARQEGIDLTGPIGADSVFYQALQGRYDAVISLYHDQGHIATKMVDFERTIAVTHGLPFLRTSVDHGTAFDIAGTGQVSAVSMIEAIRLAAKYAGARL